MKEKCIEIHVSAKQSFSKHEQVQAQQQRGGLLSKQRSSFLNVFSTLVTTRLVICRQYLLEGMHVKIPAIFY
jgi:hypothetical protein